MHWYLSTKLHIITSQKTIISLYLKFNSTVNHSLFIWQIIDITGAVYNLVTKLNNAFLIV